MLCHVRVEYLVPQAPGYCFRKCLHPLGEGKHPRTIFCDFSALLPLTGAFDHAFDQSSVLLLERIQFRKSRAHAQLFRISGVHAGDKRVNAVVQELAPEATLHKLCDGLFLRSPPDQRLPSSSLSLPRADQRRVARKAPGDMGMGCSSPSRRT